MKRKPPKTNYKLNIKCGDIVIWGFPVGVLMVAEVIDYYERPESRRPHYPLLELFPVVRDLISAGF